LGLLSPQTARALRGDALRSLLLSVPFRERDAFVDALLGVDPTPPSDIPDLPRGSVPYLPCGVSEILAMVHELPLRSDDELVDLGSGLGRVVLLAHLLSGAAARGIELQEHLVRSARASATELALDGVSFVHGNVLEAPLDGSVFFLYAPFNGPMLAGALSRLEEVARRRPIAVCAVGLELHDLPWLVRLPATCPEISLYGSVVAGVPSRNR
jgi:hypothetical protein